MGSWAAIPLTTSEIPATHTKLARAMITSSSMITIHFVHLLEDGKITEPIASAAKPVTRHPAVDASGGPHFVALRSRGTGRKAWATRILVMYPAFNWPFVAGKQATTVGHGSR
jgi:hypothetical protein